MTDNQSLDDLQIQEYIDTNCPIHCKLTVIGATQDQADRIINTVREAVAKAGAT
jgi:hypothetical protein